MLNVLLAYGVVKRPASSSWYKFPDPNFRLDDDHAQVQGEEQTLALMEQNPEWFSVLETEAKRILAGDATAGTELAEVTDEDAVELVVPDLVGGTDD